METSRRVDSPSISWNYSTPKTRGGNWCSSWTFWWHFVVIQWKPVVLYLFPSEASWYCVQRIIFFRLKTLRDYQRFCIRNFTRGLVRWFLIKWRFLFSKKTYLFHRNMSFYSTSEAIFPIWEAISPRISSNMSYLDEKYIFLWKTKTVIL